MVKHFNGKAFYAYSSRILEEVVNSRLSKEGLELLRSMMNNGTCRSPVYLHLSAKVKRRMFKVVTRAKPISSQTSESQTSAMPSFCKTKLFASPA